MMVMRNNCKTVSMFPFFLSKNIVFISHILRLAPYIHCVFGFAYASFFLRFVVSFLCVYVSFLLLCRFMLSVIAKMYFFAMKRETDEMIQME